MNNATPKWRRGSVFVAPFRVLDRNDRARILFFAEALDRRTHTPGHHGGCLGRTGLAVLRTMICRFHNIRTGRLDPSIEQIAVAANVARSTAQAAIRRLEMAGILDHARRIIRVRVREICGLTGQVSIRDRVVQTTNAYRLIVPAVDNPANNSVSSDTGIRSGTSNLSIITEKFEDTELGKALTRLGQAIKASAVIELKNA